MESVQLLELTDNDQTIVTLHFYPQLRVLVWKWYGLLRDDQLTRGAAEILREIHVQDPVGCVADVSELEGGWSVEAGLRLTELSSEELQRGIRIAVVVSDNPEPDLLTSISVERYLASGLPGLKSFHEFTEALIWAAQRGGQ